MKVFFISTVIAYNLILLWPAYSNGWSLSLIVFLYVFELVSGLTHSLGHSWAATRYKLKPGSVNLSVPPFHQVRIRDFAGSRQSHSLLKFTLNSRHPLEKLYILAYGWGVTALLALAGLAVLWLVPEFSLDKFYRFVTGTGLAEDIRHFGIEPALLCFVYVNCCRAVFVLIPANSFDGSKALLALLDFGRSHYTADKIRWTIIGIVGYLTLALSLVLGALKLFGIADVLSYYHLSVLGLVSITILSSFSFQFSPADDFESDYLL
ncbi:MAG: hypothetical protein JXA92_00945 [candidate division Zixibacteria bacterium]|nr:hypothetical protein [candidate division Zixibacteria bacterium]